MLKIHLRLAAIATGIFLWSPQTPAFAGSVSVEQASQAICGDLAKENSDSTEVLDLLNQKMPPASDQAYTEWCAVFSPVDLLNLHLQRARVRVGGPATYTEDTMISPIDVQSPTA
jgi:hypothetical protein